MSAHTGPVGGAERPTWWASLAVRSAALPLPSEHRYRYRQEFLAELYGMSSSDQLRHASGVLSRVLALRGVLTDPDRQLPMEAAMKKHWRCRLRIHRWKQLRNPEGDWYRECLRCGKQTEPGRTGGTGVYW